MSASPGELTVLCTNGLAGVMREIVPQFEGATACKVNWRLGTANALTAEIEQGAVFDLAILTGPTIDRLTATGRILPGTRTDIAQSGVGITVQPGLPKPDISTVEAFKNALLDAKSIIYTGQGASGQYFASLLPRLGIEDEVRRKATIPAGGLIAEAVVRGEVELGIQQVSEILAVPGAVLVGPLPPEVQHVTIFSAGIRARTREPWRAEALVARLTDANARALIQAKGLEPLF